MISRILTINGETNERCLRLLEFETFLNLVLTNSLGPHKPSIRWKWHSPDGKHHIQIDNILVRKSFRSGVNIHRTMSFPGPDKESGYDLVMMTCRVRLKGGEKASQPSLRFGIQKLGIHMRHTLFKQQQVRNSYHPSV